MQRSSTYKAEGIVLSRSDLGDADRIVTLYTREFGRRRLVVRGSRRPTSHLAPHLELLNRVRLFGVVGTNLDILSQAEALESYPRLREDLAAFAAAGWAIELLDGLSEDGEPVPAAYGALLTFLRGIDLSNEPPDLWFLALAMALFDAHGYSPQLHACTVCRQEIRPHDHAFAATTGGVVCGSCEHEVSTQALDVGTLKVLRHIAREGFQGTAHIRVDEDLRRQVRELLRAYSEVLVEREMKSLRMLENASSNGRTRR